MGQGWEKYLLQTMITGIKNFPGSLSHTNQWFLFAVCAANVCPQAQLFFYSPPEKAAGPCCAPLCCTNPNHFPCPLKGDCPEGQIYGDKDDLTLGGVHTMQGTYRSYILERYTCNLYDLINQCHLIIKKKLPKLFQCFFEIEA